MALGAIALMATDALAVDATSSVRTKDAAGFSEIAVPQITGTIPMQKLRAAAASAKPVGKVNANEAPNQPVNCGPENAQSIACQSKAH